jgi:hypothetical protein
MTVDHRPAHFWTKMASGRILCAYMGCQARPSPAEVAKLEAEIETAARMRVQFRMTGLPSSR